MSSDALKLFWPSHVCTPNNQRGFLIGWFNSHDTICVATVIQNVELHDLQALLSEFCRSGKHSEFSHINKVCKAPPKILGVMLDSKEKTKRVESNGHDPWITVTLDDAYVPVPLTRSHKAKQELIQVYEIIFYDQPNPKRLQFLSHDPLELDISPKEPSEARPDALLTPANKHPATLANIKKIIEYSHIYTGGTTQSSDDLVSVLVQINSSYYLEKGIEASRANQLRRSKQPDSFGWVWTVLESLGSHFVRVWMIGTMTTILQTIKRLVVGPLLCVSLVLLLVAEAFLYALNVKLPKGLLNTVALKDLSAAGQQVDLRLQQLYFWPRQYMMLRERNRANTAETRAYYISFYNSMWLVANDIIIGLAIGSFLMSNSYTVARVLHGALNKYTVESLQSMMLWFLESPAGLKLNHELASFLSELFLWLIRLWTDCMQIIGPYTPQIVHLIGLSGMFGVSMIISLSSDFLAFMTLHVYCFHMVAARIFNWQLLILHSLFNLFRGKKRNTLRNRIDSCDYDLDQLLLGTCLFTLLTFLFPTVLIYYLTFAVGRVGVIFLQAIMETLLAFFNHFPLFAIMLRAKDPDRLPGGLQFDIFDHNNFLKKHHPLCYRLKNIMLACKKAWNVVWEARIKKTSPSPSQPQPQPQPPPSLRTTKTGRLYGQKARRRLSAGSSRPKAKETRIPLDKMDTRRGTYLRMQNMPIPFGAIFFQYMLLWKRLSVHYFSFYVFKCLLCGEPIKPIPKLQYPMLPDKRPSLRVVWRSLKANLWDR